jgi:hypothetical protein
MTPMTDEYILKDFLRDLWANDRDVLAPARSRELAGLVGADVPARRRGGGAVLVGLKRAGRRVAAKIRPYANMTTAGLGTLASAGFTWNITVGLVCAGVSMLLAEWNAER